MAFARVYSLRRWAALMMWRLLSARIGGTHRAVRRRVEHGDDLVQVVHDLEVHLDHTSLPSGLGGGDDLQQLLALFAMLGHELGCGDEHRARQASVGVWARLLHRQT